MTTREQLGHELAQYVAEIGIPDLAQVQSILADHKVKGPIFERILRKLGIRVPE